VAQGAMTSLVLGLFLFLGIHLVPATPALRGGVVARLGENRYKAIFSLISFVGLALIIVGYVTSDRGPQLFTPMPWARALAPYAVTVSFILLAAANMRGYIRKGLQHPMLLGVLLWAGTHFLANGSLRASVFFGAFFAYAVVDLISAIGRHAVKSFVASAKFDVIAVVAGIALALAVMVLHRVLFGVRVVTFGL